MYYEGGISSVYAYDAEDKFVVVVLIKKGTYSQKEIYVQLKLTEI